MFPIEQTFLSYIYIAEILSYALLQPTYPFRQG